MYPDLHSIEQIDEHLSGKHLIEICPVALPGNEYGEKCFLKLRW